VYVPPTEEFDGFSVEAELAHISNLDHPLITADRFEPDCVMIVVECIGDDPLWPEPAIEVIFMVRLRYEEQCELDELPDNVLVLGASDSPLRLCLRACRFMGDAFGAYLVAECESPRAEGNTGTIEHAMLVTTPALMVGTA
jgi:hypothetical protein